MACICFNHFRLVEVRHSYLNLERFSCIISIFIFRKYDFLDVLISNMIDVYLRELQRNCFNTI